MHYTFWIHFLVAAVGFSGVLSSSTDARANTPKHFEPLAPNDIVVVDEEDGSIGLYMKSEAEELGKNFRRPHKRGMVPQLTCHSWGTASCEYAQRKGECEDSISPQNYAVTCAGCYDRNNRDPRTITDQTILRNTCPGESRCFTGQGPNYWREYESFVYCSNPEKRQWQIKTDPNTLADKRQCGPGINNKTGADINIEVEVESKSDDGRFPITARSIAMVKNGVTYESALSVDHVEYAMTLGAKGSTQGCITTRGDKDQILLGILTVWILRVSIDPIK